MGLAGLSTGFLFFCFFCFINRGRQPTASVNAGLTMMKDPRRLQKPPRLMLFARLG